MESLSPPNCIRTFTGMEINVFDPDPETIKIEDIAHALSFHCRFGGHLPEFYSVAQHSVLAARVVDEKHELQALLHDASEAYLLDIPTPIKKRLGDYKEVEDNLMKAIAKKFGFQYPLNEAVKEADEYMLNREWNDLMLKKGGLLKIECWSPETSERNFLQKYGELALGYCKHTYSRSMNQTYPRKCIKCSEVEIYHELIKK